MLCVREFSLSLLPKRSSFSFNKIVTTTLGEIAVTTKLRTEKEEEGGGGGIKN
jgi:hypothetical protein